MAGLWRPPKKTAPQMIRLSHQGKAVRHLLLLTRPDLVVIEECAPDRNFTVVRALVRAEAVLNYEATLLGIPVYLCRVSEARKAAVGSGRATKEGVFEIMRAGYPNITTWPPMNDGGDDISDAIAMAIAGPMMQARPKAPRKKKKVGPVVVS